MCEELKDHEVAMDKKFKAIMLQMIGKLRKMMENQRKMMIGAGAER